jgi:hypothetical protein
VRVVVFITNNRRVSHRSTTGFVRRIGDVNENYTYHNFPISLPGANFGGWRAQQREAACPGMKWTTDHRADAELWHHISIAIGGLLARPSFTTLYHL